ncbi:MAG: CobW family GTP-binding protein [Mangrovibacterium sp.]
MMKKIPVNIISGFLGSGKTTAIIQLLRQKTDEGQWAVLVNEFGQISIDGQTVKSSSQEGTVYNISGGCICCSAKGYFYENLIKIARSDNYSRIIIEPSGLGGIEMITEIIGYIPELCLMPILCLVDITGVENLRLQLNPVYRAQISKADVIVFSKCDLVTEKTEQERLTGKFKTIFPISRNCITNEADLLTSLLNMKAQDNQEINKYRMLSSTEPVLTNHSYQERNYSFNAMTVFDVSSLSRLFTVNASVIRAKGHVRTRDGWKLLNYTLSGCTFDPCQEKEQNELVIIAEKSAPDLFQNLSVEIEKAVISLV